jgi:hypothetical protein
VVESASFDIGCLHWSDPHQQLEHSQTLGGSIEVPLHQSQSLSFPKKIQKETKKWMEKMPEHFGAKIVTLKQSMELPQDP